MPVAVHVPHWPRNEDVIYYLIREPATQQVTSEAALLQALRESRLLVLVTGLPTLRDLQTRRDLSIEIRREFHQPRGKQHYVVALRL